jgi:acyl-CoA thioesterase
MTGLKAILDALEPVDGGWRGAIPDTWLQGRTAYGGLSTALALHAAQASDVDLPPLRSAQVAFVGPLSGTVMVTAHRLRRGRNAAFVQADVESEAGLGLRATFVFMGATRSALDHVVPTAPAFPPPAPGARTFTAVRNVAFTQHFEFVDQRGPEVGPAEWLRWVRLRERDGLDPMVELACIGDCLPPAALKLLGAPVPLSSMTWLLNLLSPPQTRDGWFLLRANADYARAGSSSQVMGIWNTDGLAVAEHMQSVAIFG